MTSKISKLVVILLGAYNGQKYLLEQLRSLSAQTHKNWRLIVSDDGSSDKTLEIVKEFQQSLGDDVVEIRNGPRKGFAQNFLSMACDPSIKADYYAFCDQDDVWFPEKLEVAIDYLNSVENRELPQVYRGRTAYVRDDLKPYRYSPEFVFPRTFRNALIQSIAGGNTMVFNTATKTLLENVGIVPTPSHDWWLYQLVTAAAGDVYYDKNPYVLYRQHPNALIGGNTSIWARLDRFGMVIQGRFKTFSDQNIQCLRQSYPYITRSARDKVELFAKMREAGFKNRMRLLEVCGLYRQTWRGTLSLMFAALIKKV